MSPETKAFLLRSQQAVVDGYRRVLALYPDISVYDRAEIEDHLQHAEEQLRQFGGATPE
jgi:hypothetical protein